MRYGSFHQLKNHVSGVLVCALLAILCAAGFCVAFIGVTTDVASAADVMEYTVFIRQRDENNNLYVEGDYYWVENAEGAHILDAYSTSFVGVPENIIGAINNDRGDNEYSIKFDLAPIKITAKEGIVENPYTSKEDSQIVIVAEVDNVFGTDYTRIWQYKTRDTTDYTNDELNADREYRFGTNMDVGWYDVRLEVIQEFIIDGRNYSIVRNSDLIECEITMSGDCDYHIPTPSAKYGATLSALADAASLADNSGIWTLNAAEDANKVLNSGTHTVKMDFQSNNSNYHPVQSIDVSVTIEPYQLKAVVTTASSVCGAPLVESFTCEVISSLVGDDTVEGLGITLSTDADMHTAGIYRIMGQAANQNYQIIFRSESDPDGNMDTGGEYWVLPDKLIAHVRTQSDDIAVIVKNEQGFPFSVSLIAELIQVQLPDIKMDVEDPRLLYAIGIKLLNDDGTQYVAGNYSFMISNANRAVKAIFDLNGEVQILDVVNGDVELAINANSLCVMLIASDIEYVDYNAITIALACIAVALLIGLCIILIMIRGERRK